MPASPESRFEEIAQKARKAQDAIDKIRGSISLAGVRIEVNAEGRITGLDMANHELAQMIVFAHNQALDAALEQVAEQRRILAEDTAVSAIIRRLIAEVPPAEPPAPRLREVSAIRAGDEPNEVLPRPEPIPEPWDDPDYQNPFALPRHIQRRYGICP
ncbi:YbaB/EbfC family DNA-binding protein [Nocardia yunnanensis]|uniref:YbaB/EbfC family DNA-binding protein n=1 Tax=Nocardia yunnanensis TaxID=2382165 RepID=A0A386ZFW1_9NOCA|nr:YbaB/EbfC family nucleoid-associated protein [Nocardia yunnanensis]AYF75505.1 YbaB/EbfC family DNA-binding protein [Nocardia yunnanensis]